MEVEMRGQPPSQRADESAHCDQVGGDCLSQRIVTGHRRPGGDDHHQNKRQAEAGPEKIDANRSTGRNTDQPPERM